MTDYMIAKNPHQGDFLKVLFVCSAGILRSATAAWWATRNKEWNVRNAGTYEYALVPLTKDLVQWADRIYFMHSDNYQMARSVGLVAEADDNRVYTLEIQDNYGYRDPELIETIASLLADE